MVEYVDHPKHKSREIVVPAGRRKDAVAERDEIAVAVGEAGAPQPNKGEELLALALDISISERTCANTANAVLQ
jgi:hypothetical protein